MLNKPATNKAEVYNCIEWYIAEIYDQTETQLLDVALIKSLIGNRPARVLEPFCGHGRIMIPLATAGYEVVGLDLSDWLLHSLADRLQKLPLEIQARAVFHKADVIKDEWPTGFDVVILGSNCFYELATPEEQEHCIKAASRSLAPGGYLYLDNNHMEGNLDESWYTPGVNENAFPTGACADGTQVHGRSEVIWYDVEKRLIRFRRKVTMQTPDGNVHEKEWVQQKHPPSTEKMTEWLGKHGFAIEGCWGTWQQECYTKDSPRAIFWARKQ